MMELLRILLAKDLLRIRRRPAPIIIQMGISLVIVAMIGLAFGRSGESGGGMAPIKMAIVDEDDSLLTQFLEGSASSPEMAEHFDVRFLEREEAIEMIGEGELSAVLIFPERMTDYFLEGGENPLEIELIKNPAQSVYPAIVEEGIEAVITVLNAISRNFREDLHYYSEVLEGGLKDDAFLANAAFVAGVWTDALKRLEAVKDYLNPPLVWFGSETRAEPKDEGEEKPDFNLIAYIYVGLGGTFLLIISNSVTSDIYREGRFGTLRRFASLRDGSLVYVTEKAILTLVVTLISAVVMFVGVALIFRFRWVNPVEMTVLIVCFTICSAGITSLMAGIMGTEKRADAMGVMFFMGMAMLSGGMIQTEMLPSFIGKNISPYLPMEWFISPARAMQAGAADVAWAGDAVKLLICGVVCVAASSAIFNRRLRSKGGVG